MSSVLLAEDFVALQSLRWHLLQVSAVTAAALCRVRPDGWMLSQAIGANNEWQLSLVLTGLLLQDTH